MVAELDHETWKTLHHKAVILGGECTLVAVTLSAYLLASHFASYHRPEEQKWVVAIIFMVPIYALDSWLSLISVENSLFFNMARDCYEAYAIYAFGCYLVSCLGGTEGVITVLHNLGLGEYNPDGSTDTDPEKARSATTVGQATPPASPRPRGVVTVNNGMPPPGASSSSDGVACLTPVTSKLAWVFGRGRRSGGPSWAPLAGSSHRRAGSDVAGQGFYGTLAAGGGGRKKSSGFRHEVRHPAPLCWLAPWQMGEPFFLNFKFAIIQYVTLKVLCTIMEGILRACGAYGEGSFRFNKGYLYLVIIQNFSQCWALYCLVQFYYATQGVLAPRRPLLKFLCIKMVIFVTWWQGLALAALDAFGYIPGSGQVPAAVVRSTVQDVLICCEMCVAAIAHMYAFPASYYAALEPDRSAMQLGGIDTQPLLASGMGGYGTVGGTAGVAAALGGSAGGSGGSGGGPFSGEGLLKQVLSPGNGDSAKCIGDMEYWDPEQGGVPGGRGLLHPDGRLAQGPPGYHPGIGLARDGAATTYGTTQGGDARGTNSPSSRKPRAWKNIQRGMKDAVVGSGRSVVEDIREFMVDPMARQLDAAQDFGIGLGKAALNAIPGVATTSFDTTDRKLAKKARAPTGPIVSGPGAARNLRRKMGAGRGGKLLWEGVDAQGVSGGDSGSGTATPGGGGDATSGTDDGGSQGAAAWIDVSGHGGKPRIIFGGGEEAGGEDLEGYYDYSTEEEELVAPPDGPVLVNPAPHLSAAPQPAPDGSTGPRI